MENSKEKRPSFVINGWLALIIILGAVAYFGTKIYHYAANPETTEVHQDIIVDSEYAWGSIVTNSLFVVLFLITLFGLITLKPNEGAVYSFMGKYMGTLKDSGFFWLPFWWAAYSVRNLAIQTVKIEQITVNDKNGKPILIGCDIFCLEKDTYKATYDISDLSEYLPSKGEVALRKLAMSHPMDAADNEISLRGQTDVIAEELEKKVSEAFEKAGYTIESAAITRLTYAPEIAGAMLQKQQAGALIEARELITKGAVAIVKSTLEQIKQEGIVEFDEASKQKLVSNLLVTLCNSQNVVPVMEM